MVQEIKNNLKELGFQENEIKVYIALTQLGEAKASQISKKADLPRTTVISILAKLAAENYLTTHRYRGITYYWIESPKAIINILENKIEIAKKLNEYLTNIYRSEAHFPFAQVFDSKSGIKNFIERTLANLERKSIIYTIDTPAEGNYAKIFSEDVGNIIADLKKKREVSTRTLIPYGSFTSIVSHKIKGQNILIREMPQGLNFKSSLWVIKDMIVHFSSQPPFLVVVKHDIITRGMRSLYEFLWQISVAKN